MYLSGLKLIFLDFVLLFHLMTFMKLAFIETMYLLSLNFTVESIENLIIVFYSGDNLLVPLSEKSLFQRNYLL